jgi:hypothetical protein
LNQRQENAALLRKAGVHVVLVTNKDGGDVAVTMLATSSTKQATR